MEYKRPVINSIARLKKNGNNYEIIIDSETALKVRDGKAGIEEALLAPNVYKDAHKGDVAGNLKDAFGTEDVNKAALEIIMYGEIQLTEEYRKKITEELKNKVINEILSKASDPVTHNPMPRQRLELGIDKSGYKVRFDKTASEQVKELTDLLPKIMPITFKEIIVTIISPAQYTAQVYNLAKKAGEVIEQNYLPDGSLSLRIKTSAAGRIELNDKLKSISHGLIKIMEE